MPAPRTKCMVMFAAAAVIQPRIYMQSHIHAISVKSMSMCSIPLTETIKYESRVYVCVGVGGRGGGAKNIVYITFAFL